MKNEGKIIHFPQQQNIKDQEERAIKEIDLTPEEVLSHFSWSQNVYRETAELLIQSMNDRYPQPIVSLAVLLWGIYTQEMQPRIQKPSVCIASMEYIISEVFEEWPVTQSELAKRYHVSAAAISQRYQDMAYFFSEVLFKNMGQIAENVLGSDDVPDEFDDFLSEHAFPSFATSKHTEKINYLLSKKIQEKEFDSPEDVNQYLQELMADTDQFEDYQPKDAREKAQMLLYEAWEAPSPREQKRLAKQALEIYPDSPDAYVIFAEHATTPKKALQYYLQGVKAGERDLGPDYFEENRGHFWGLVETRPYMRAKAGYAKMLWLLGRHQEAIREYEEMLDLNPNDNQGIRYLLLTCYIERREYEKAKQLLDSYDEPTAYFAYSRLLVEYALKGIGFKLKKLLEEAVEANPHVIPYLLGQRLLPEEPPEYIGFGDESEAVAYAYENIHLWHREKPLMLWLAKQSESL